jgi:hypothetical protein
MSLELRWWMFGRWAGAAGRVVSNEALGGGRDYFLCFLLVGVESAHDRFCRARNVHSSSQKGSILKLSNSCLCLKNIRVLQTAQLAMYLDDRLFSVLPIPELPGVGLAMG